MDQRTTSINRPHHGRRDLALVPIAARAFEASTTSHVGAFKAVGRAPGTRVQAIAFEMLGSTLDASRWDGGPLSGLIRSRGGN